MTDYEDLLYDVFQPLSKILGLVYFLCLIIFDACVEIAGKPGRIWFPTKSLVISALTIQVLSYLEIDIAEGDKKESVFVGESARVVTCVLVGYFLPGMARAGSASDWRTLAALVLSLFTTEFYFVIEVSSTHEIWGSKYNVCRFIINVFIMVSIILMVLFSVCAILAGRTIRDMFAQRICVIQSDKNNKSEELSLVEFEGEIVESWFLARVCHPQYVIARSVLSSGLGVLVTICIISLAILQFYIYWSSKVRDTFFTDAGPIVMIAWMVEWAFILIGGAIICCRWLTAVVYFPKFLVKKEKQNRPRPFVEDFWTRSILELVQSYNLQKWNLQEQSKDEKFKGLALRVATAMKIHYLFSLLEPLNIALICFCKCCFFISELAFSFKFVCNYLFGTGSDKISSQLQGEFEEYYREILEKLCMPGENPDSLWIANEKSMKQAKKHIKENKEKDCNFDKLLEFIRPHLVESNNDRRFVNELERVPVVAKHFPALDENRIRITTLSLLIVIIHLLPFHRDVDKMKKAIEAYRQALDLMSFVDNSDPQQLTTINMIKVIDIEADRVGLAVYNEFQSLQEKQTFLQKTPNSAAPEPALLAALKIINDLRKEAEEKLNAQGLPIEKEKQHIGGEEQILREEYGDSRDWSIVAASYSKYRVCKLILSRSYRDEHELMDFLYNSLADVLEYCLLKLPNVMVKTCREWAVKFEEEKIWDAMSTARKLIGVMEKCNVEKLSMSPTYKDSETQTV